MMQPMHFPGQKTIFISNIPSSITYSTVKDLFDSFGPIESMSAFPDPSNGMHFAIISFLRSDSAGIAAEMSGINLHNQPLHIIAYGPKQPIDFDSLQPLEERGLPPELMDMKAVHVGNIDKSVTIDDLKHHFSICGEISNARIIKHDPWQSVTYGFVEFVHPEGAIRALNLAETLLAGLPIKVGKAKGATTAGPSLSTITSADTSIADVKNSLFEHLSKIEQKHKQSGGGSQSRTSDRRTRSPDRHRRDYHSRRRYSSDSDSSSPRRNQERYRHSRRD
ncbi:hypothetical protein BLNAU_12633 [Blattamonas nauphoetae]|uniref:RRM domain-containing protein n=1 Tax=Blattamonas nauphoetae TaxID=2049346 RepID=A0ABQ9XIW5_9EUKA|nr:hypothetical protein BLNAU_12633 [Blattamonas nauphoetae]